MKGVHRPPNYDGLTRTISPILSRTETSKRAGGRAPGPRVLLDMRTLQGPSATRGVGSYANGILRGLIEEGFDANLTLLLDSGLPVPPLPVGEYRLASSRRRYHGQLAAYEEAVPPPSGPGPIAPPPSPPPPPPLPRPPPLPS